MENKFEDMLKNVLRSNPEQIIVGEIRDEEAFKQIMEAMSTGHNASTMYSFMSNEIKPQLNHT